MKKVTINFIISLAVAALLLVLTLFLGIFLSELGSGLGELGEDINTIFDDGEVDTVEGHGAILQGAGLALGAFMGAVIFAIVVLAGGYSLLLILFAVVARAVYAPRGGRLLVYRILMGVEYVLQAGIVWLGLDLGFGGSDFISFLMIILAVAIAGGIVYSGVNTYSKRICE